MYGGREDEKVCMEGGGVRRCVWREGVCVWGGGGGG